MLVEEPCRPYIRAPAGFKHRGCGPNIETRSPEVVDDHLTGWNNPVSNREAYAVEHMVAVGFKNHMRTAHNRSSRELGEQCLPGRVDIDRGILNDAQMLP